MSKKLFQWFYWHIDWWRPQKVSILMLRHPFQEGTQWGDWPQGESYSFDIKVDRNTWTSPCFRMPELSFFYVGIKKCMPYVTTRINKQSRPMWQKHSRLPLHHTWIDLEVSSINCKSVLEKERWKYLPVASLQWSYHGEQWEFCGWLMLNSVFVRTAYQSLDLIDHLVRFID